jgi:hypothetical protein
MTTAVPDGESVWRSAVFPFAFKPKQKQLHTKSFFKLYTDQAAPFTAEMSLALGKYAPTLPMVHRFGCRLAASQNRDLDKRGKRTDRIYCGAYELRAGDIHALRGTANLLEVTRAEVIHAVETGEVAHANLRIEIDTGGDVEAVEQVKTLIIDRLWHRSAGPEKYVCLCDEKVDPHPSEWMQNGPNGSYVDRRSKAEVVIEVLLYFLYHFPRLWIAYQAGKVFGSVRPTT